MIFAHGAEYPLPDGRLLARELPSIAAKYEHRQADRSDVHRGYLVARERLRARNKALVRLG